MKKKAKGSAKDDFVSRKIKILREEGYPQKQAVAIALNMEREKRRRGKKAHKKK